MRIERIISLIDRCPVIMDVGCDHGLISKAVLDKGLCERLIATDISEKCLNKARRLLRNYDNATFAVGNGIVDTEIKPDFIIICGMGGHTIRDILSAYSGTAALLLSPHSHSEEVRGFLASRGYKTVCDTCIEAGGKFYDIIKAEYTGVPANPTYLELKYGSYKIKNEALKKRLTNMLSKLPAGGDKYREVSEVLKWQQ